MATQELLHNYIFAPNDEAERFTGERLFEVVETVIRKAAAKKETGDLEDFESECVCAVWSKLRELREQAKVDGENIESIENLEAFVRRVVSNRFCDAVRRKRPSWYNLKLELMEMFTGRLNVKGFALWQCGRSSEKLCGFSAWEGRSDSCSAKCQELADKPEAFTRQALDNKNPAEIPVAQLAIKILSWINGPVGVDDLTSCIASLRQVRDVEPLSIDAEPESSEDFDSPLDWLVASDDNVEREVVDGHWLDGVISRFWHEFCGLSSKQRVAILCGLSTEQVMIIAGNVGGLKVLAQVVEMEDTEFIRLVPNLPLPDSAIAEQLDLPPRSVPSVRFKAWQRIQRHMRKMDLL
jgi:DNA-directed RNA polymerase specialized sigma24 family protein